MVNRNNKELNNSNSLSILIQQGGFSFYLHTKNSSSTKKYADIKVDDIQLKTSIKLFEKNIQELTGLYDLQNVRLVFANELYCLVPKIYYDDTAKADYLKYNVQLLPEDQIIAENISEIETVLLFIPYMNYHNALLEYVDEFEFTHLSQLLIEETGKKLLADTQKLMVVVRINQLDVIGFEGLNFKMCNTFSFSTDIDIVYYILFCVEELRFDQEKMNLYISYNQKETDWLDVIKKYVKNVHANQDNFDALI